MELGVSNYSPCHLPHYIPSKVALTDPKTVQQLVKQLKSIIFHSPLAEYVQIIINFLKCRDTFYVENFNHHLLCYIPKGIYFSTRVYSYYNENEPGCS